MKKNWAKTPLTDGGSITALIPVTNRKFLYFLTILGAYFLYLTNVFKTDLLLRTQGTLCNALLFILAITLFHTDTKPFFNKGKGFFHLLELCVTLYFTTIAVNIALSFLIHVDDPQNLSRFMYDFSLPYVTYNIIKYFFVGVGEECFKLFIFLLLFGLFHVVARGRHKKINCILAVILTSFFFGALHNFYAPENWIAITIPIAASTMVYFYYLFKHKTILPLMITHAFHDIFIFLTLMNGYSEMNESIITLFLMILFLIFGCKSLFLKKPQIA
ncbi:MAG TPA: hypothetical protein DCY20_06390 [Firmicutes bacterium]|nr:hypothetical protein [Bacillota bacterium]